MHSYKHQFGLEWDGKRKYARDRVRMRFEDRLKSQHATNNVIFKELVKSLPHLGQKATNLRCYRTHNSKHNTHAHAHIFIAFYACPLLVFLLKCIQMHIEAFLWFLRWKCTRVQSFDFSRKTKLNGVYKIFIFVLLYFWSLFTMNVRAFFSPCHSPLTSTFNAAVAFPMRLNCLPRTIYFVSLWLLLVWPLCFHCDCLCIPIFWWLKWRDTQSERDTDWSKKK